MEEREEERRDADRQAVLYVVTTQGGGKWKPEGAVTQQGEGAVTSPGAVQLAEEKVTGTRADE